MTAIMPTAQTAFEQSLYDMRFYRAQDGCWYIEGKPMVSRVRLKMVSNGIYRVERKDSNAWVPGIEALVSDFDPYAFRNYLGVGNNPI
jgi:hypothetical protein